MVSEMTAAEKIKRLQDCVAARYDGSNMIYLIINHIDPDSLATVFGLRHVLKRLGFDRIKVLFCGKAGNEQNSYIIYGMDLMAKMAPLAVAAANFTDKDVFALVDATSAVDERLGETSGKFSPSIVIDHHRSDTRPENTGDNFIWIEDRGSCASMIVELIEQIGFDFSAKGDDDLPTLLALGIYVDSDSFVYVDERDCLAYARIIVHCDKDRLQLFINYPISDDYIRAEQYALDQRKERGSIVVTSVGAISGANAAHIAIIADRHIRRKGYTMAVVWGWLDGKELYICARSTDSTAPLQEFLRFRFGDRAGAKLSPGGRISKGAAQISWSAGDLVTSESLPHFLSAIGAWVENKVFS